MRRGAAAAEGSLQRLGRRVHGCSHGGGTVPFAASIYWSQTRRGGNTPLSREKRSVCVFQRFFLLDLVSLDALTERFSSFGSADGSEDRGSANP